MARHHPEEERIQLLAQIEQQRMGPKEREAFYRKHAMSESTYFLWKRKYMRNEQEKSLILQAHDATHRQCRGILKELHLLRNPPKLEPFLSFASMGDFLQKHQVREQGEDGYWSPETNLDKQGQGLWAQWESLQYEKNQLWVAKNVKPLEKRAADEADELEALRESLPPIQYAVTDRYEGNNRVRIYGRLPTGKTTPITLHLPADLHWRLTRDVDGSMSQCIPALLRYALDCLDVHREMLHVYDENKGRPQLDTSYTRFGSISQAERAALRRKIQQQHC